MHAIPFLDFWHPNFSPTTEEMLPLVQLMTEERLFLSQAHHDVEKESDGNDENEVMTIAGVNDDECTNASKILSSMSNQKSNSSWQATTWVSAMLATSSDYSNIYWKSFGGQKYPLEKLSSTQLSHRNISWSPWISWITWRCPMMQCTFRWNGSSWSYWDQSLIYNLVWLWSSDEVN